MPYFLLNSPTLPPPHQVPPCNAVKLTWQYWTQREKNRWLADRAGRRPRRPDAGKELEKRVWRVSMVCTHNGLTMAGRPRAGSPGWLAPGSPCCSGVPAGPVDFTPRGEQNKHNQLGEAPPTP